MSRQEIHVTFDPASQHEEQFSFVPERVILDGRTSTVDVILHTKGGKGTQAKFLASEAIQWITEGPQDLQVTLKPNRKLLALRGFPVNETQEEIDYGYAVTVEYEGLTLSSSIAQYPEMSCVQTGGGG